MISYLYMFALIFLIIHYPSSASPTWLLFSPLVLNFQKSFLLDSNNNLSIVHIVQILAVQYFHFFILVFVYLMAKITNGASSTGLRPLDFYFTPLRLNFQNYFLSVHTVWLLCVVLKRYVLLKYGDATGQCTLIIFWLSSSFIICGPNPEMPTGLCTIKNITVTGDLEAKLVFCIISVQIFDTRLYALL